MPTFEGFEIGETIIIGGIKKSKDSFRGYGTRKKRFKGRQKLNGSIKHIRLMDFRSII